MFAETLKELNKSGIRHFVLDRCPRCWSFPVTNGATIPTADAATANWAFVKAVEMTRADYYLQVARHRAAAGDWAASRDICLLAVAHVTPEDSRFHVHLASVAEKLQDEVMLMEAKEAVRHLHRPLFRLSPFRTDIDLNFFDSAVEI